MPIRPENLERYPAEWPQIREKILTRAGQRRNSLGGVEREAKCEWCGVENHAMGMRTESGKFVELSACEADERFALDGLPVLVIVLTIAHVHDPSPENCADDNLAALCQRCHLNHDRPHHNMMRVQNAIDRDVAAGQMLLTDLLPKREVSP
jgi:hypothetical protein